jgi:uncharacterized membrane protein
MKKLTISLTAALILTVLYLVPTMYGEGATLNFETLMTIFISFLTMFSIIYILILLTTFIYKISDKSGVLMEVEADKIETLKPPKEEMPKSQKKAKQMKIVIPILFILELLLGAGGILLIFGLISTVLSIYTIVSIIQLIKYKNEENRDYIEKRKFPYYYNREIPKDITPTLGAIIAQSKNPNKNMLFATIMNMHCKKIINIANDLTITLNNINKTKLNKEEQLIFTYIKISLEDNKKLTVYDLAKRGYQNSNFWSSWIILMRREIYSRKVFSTFKTTVFTINFAIIYLVTLIFAYSSLYFNHGAIPALIINILIFGAFAAVYIFMLKRIRINITYIEEKTRLKAYERFLKHFSAMEDDTYKHVELWDQHLVYALSFGIADNIEKQLKLRGMM